MAHFIRVRTAFVGYHRWADAPPDVVFLRDLHRHKFGVQIVLAVGHGDRQLEFFQVQRKAYNFVLHKYQGKKFELSCEQIAEEIGRHMGAVMVEVDEDGENAGIWMADVPVGFNNPRSFQ